MGINTELNLYGAKIEGLINQYLEIKHLDSAIEKYNLQKTKVYRVVKPNALEEITGLSQEDFIMKFFPSEENAKELESLLKGKIQKNKGYLSTFINMDETFRLYPDSEILFELDVPESAKGAKLGKNSALIDQEEILFARDTDIEFTKVEYKEVKWNDDNGYEKLNRVFAIKGKIKSIKEKLNLVETDNTTPFDIILNEYNKAISEEKNISKVIKRISNKINTELEGFEFRLKTLESYNRKVNLNINQYINTNNVSLDKASKYVVENIYDNEGKIKQRNDRNL